MICPKCGTVLPDQSKFCGKCGNVLEVQAPPVQAPPPPAQFNPPTYQPPAQVNPPAYQPPAQFSPPAYQPPAQFSPSAYQPPAQATPPPVYAQPAYRPPVVPVEPKAPGKPAKFRAAAFGGILGGGLSLLGWFLPWLSLFGLGSYVGGIGALGLGSGLGNGLQILFGSVVGVFATLSSSSQSAGGAVVGFLIAAAVLIFLLLAGILVLINGLQIMGNNEPYDEENNRKLNKLAGRIRANALAGFIIMLVVFILVSVVPFLSSFTGIGYFLTAGGLLLAYLVGMANK